MLNGWKDLKKKGYSLVEIPFLAMVFGVGIITTSIVAQIVGDVRADQTIDTVQYNVSTKGLAGQLKFANWFSTIGLILGAVIVISALGTMFVFNRKQ